MKNMLLVALVLSACVVRRIPRPKGTQSFRVSVVKPEDPAALGTKAAPLEYASSTAPFQASFRLEALDFGGQADPSYNGRLIIDAHPGEVFPNEMNIKDGVGEVTVRLANSYGETRIWFEDCGERELPENANCTLEDRQAYKPECYPRFKSGTLATGISPAILFAQPTISQVQATTDNATSPLQPTAGDRCAALADPRYIDTTNLTPLQVGQLPAGQKIPNVGNTVKVDKGTMIVTAINSGGFFLTDISEEARATGFNSIYVFNFGFPRNLVVGDRILALTGTPAEFVGATQLNNPFWIKDPKGPYADKVPTPYHISAETYATAVSSTGANIYNEMALEKLEGAVVCMDNLQVPSGAENCDKNNDGSLTRGGGSVEQACENLCYSNPDCFESAGYFAFGNWGAALTTLASGTAKVGMDFSGAYPGFRPDIYARTPEKYDATAMPGDAAKLISVTGNLNHILGARPVWVIEPRGKDDVRFGGTCP